MHHTTGCDTQWEVQLRRRHATIRPQHPARRRGHATATSPISRHPTKQRLPDCKVRRAWWTIYSGGVSVLTASGPSSAFIQRPFSAHSIWSFLSIYSGGVSVLTASGPSSLIILLPGLTSQSPLSLASIFQGHGGIPKCSAPGIGQAERRVWRVTGCKPGQAPDIVHAPLWFLCDGSALSQVERRPSTPSRCRNCLNSCGCPGVSWRAQGQHWRMEELNVLGL